MLFVLSYLMIGITNWCPLECQAMLHFGLMANKLLTQYYVVIPLINRLPCQQLSVHAFVRGLDKQPRSNIKSSTLLILLYYLLLNHEQLNIVLTFSSSAHSFVRSFIQPALHSQQRATLQVSIDGHCNDLPRLFISQVILFSV